MPLRFEDLVEIQLLVKEKRTKSISYQFRFWKLNENPPVEVARGLLTIVCVSHQLDGKMTSVPIPQEISEKIEVAPTQLLA